MTDSVLYQERDTLGIVTMNRPAKLNYSICLRPY